MLELLVQLTLILAFDASILFFVFGAFLTTVFALQELARLFGRAECYFFPRIFWMHVCFHVLWYVRR